VTILGHRKTGWKSQTRGVSG